MAFFQALEFLHISPASRLVVCKNGGLPKFYLFRIKGPNFRIKIWTPNSDSGSGNSDAGVTRRDALRSDESFKILILILMQILYYMLYSVLLALPSSARRDPRKEASKKLFSFPLVSRPEDWCCPRCGSRLALPPHQTQVYDTQRHQELKHTSGP